MIRVFTTFTGPRSPPRREGHAELLPEEADRDPLRFALLGAVTRCRAPTLDLDLICSRILARMSVDPAGFTDQQLLGEIVKSGGELLRAGQLRLAALGDVPNDPRWGAPIPIRFELQVPVLFLGSLDACDATISLLRARASQQAFHTLRFQIESVALIRWMAEPTDAANRQHRAYRVACGQVSRFGRFMMRDARRDRSRDALDGVRAVRDWGANLREIAKEDGIPHLKQEPDAIDLFKSLDDMGGYANFSMYSEFGSHPGTAGNTFFAVASQGEKISYDLQGAFVERTFLGGTSLFYLWKTCEAVSGALGWDEWLQLEAWPVYREILPLLEESVRRRKASRDGPPDPVPS